MATRRRYAAAALLVGCCIAGAQSGGPYEITRSAITGGGPASGGDYELIGAVAQPDANPAVLTGDALEVRGGLYSSPVEIVDEVVFNDGFESVLRR